MSKKLEVKIFPKEDNKYIVEVNDVFCERFCSCIKSLLLCLCHNCCRLVILILLVMSIVYTVFVFQKAKESSDSDTRCLVEKTEEMPKGISQSEQTITTIKLKSQSFYFLYFIILVLTDTALIILFIKDDTGIRYAKLNELSSIKDKIDNFRDSHDKNNTTVEEKTENCIQKATVTNSKTTTETSNRAALLKHYMDCLVEI